MKKSERKYFSVFDIAVILIVIVASILALLSQFHSTDSDLTCVVRYNGEIVYSQLLSSVENTVEKKVEGDLPVTVMLTENGVWVESASCPDKLCEHTGEITRSGQSIVCLPAKVSVTLESGFSQLDAVVG